VAPVDGLVSPAYVVARPYEGTDTRYFSYLFRIDAYMAEIDGYSRGIVKDRNRLYWDDFKRMPSCYPLPEEQAAIANYLDANAVLVRKFIRNRRRLIDALNEQKQAIINEVVTRGLDKNVKLKPSGVDWLGDLPEYWEVRRLRNVAELRVSNVDKHTKEGETPVRLCNYTDVYKNSVITSDMPFMRATATPDEIHAFRLQVGDVVITKDSEEWLDIGVPALIAQTSDDLVCGYHLAILRPKPQVATGGFLAYAMRCRGVTLQLSLAANGVTRYGLSHGAIKAISVPVPPVDEQEPIAQYIDQATATLNKAIHGANQEIDLIREYRTRLIADAVTGKLDVRHLAPPPGNLEEELAGIEADEILDDESVEEDADLVEESSDAVD
jgi:type I restriction enzyme S subunit